MVVAKYAMIAVTVLCVAGALLVPYVFMVPMILSAVVCYFVVTGQKIEYEYTYYDGEIRMAKIKDKRKRKELVAAEMEDIMIMAPRGSEALRPYSSQNPNAEKYKVLDYTSHVKGTPCYVLVYRKEKEIRKVFFEPEEKLVKAMRSRDMRKIQQV